MKWSIWVANIPENAKLIDARSDASLERFKTRQKRKVKKAEVRKIMAKPILYA